MKTHTQADSRQRFTAARGNAIDCRPTTSVQPDGTWIARYPCALELVAGRTDHQARRGLSERSTLRAPDSAANQWQHRSFDDDLAATTDEQVKLALRALIYRRKHVVRQTLRRNGSR